MKEDILEGLKSATSKGESLEQAMQSFYNAGYKKEEIEEAARDLQKHQFENQKPVEQDKSPKENKQIPKQIKSGKTIQKVSNYEQTTKKPKRKIMIFLLVAALLILLGVLTGIFLFKEELAGLFNKLF
ncbi:hypothetical protein CMI40_00355 [Candidatus Pacearchaeota archaeon]|jgi:hypothetical protein|nr:hypothetical protein [Candidatus Pacearchaeota archaeon]|tara:strand:- start:14665 stop:15048 length:384 start_codon:yes stop_codon:yes gene_type:complete